MKKIILQNSYKRLSSYYDKVVNASVLENYKNNIGKIEGKDILDLGCGTGSLLRHYSKKNSTTGIDNSKEMIRIARSKDSFSKYVVGDIRDIQLGKKFDLILCAYDTINHMLLFDDWRSLFNTVHLNLKDNGTFMFDYNTQKGLCENSGVNMRLINNDIIVSDVKMRDDLSVWQFYIFEKKPQDIYKLYKSKIVETSFPDKNIRAELNKYFKKIEIIHDNGNRVYIRALKKAI